MDNEKVRLQPMVDKETADHLQEEASQTGAKLAPYVANLLTTHVKKQKQIKPHTSKQEYGS